MTLEELLHGRPARISTRSTNHMWRGFARSGTQTACTSQPPVLRGAPPVSAPAGVPWTHRLRLSFFVFVIRRCNNPPRRGARGEEGGRWGARARERDRLGPRPRSPLRTLDTRIKRGHSRIRDRAGRSAGRGVKRGAAAPGRRRPGPAAARVRRELSRADPARHVEYELGTIKNSLQILTPDYIRRYLDTHKLQQSLQQKHTARVRVPVCGGAYRAGGCGVRC